jgi:hypothetical protein
MDDSSGRFEPQAGILAGVSQVLVLPLSGNQPQ